MYIVFILQYQKVQINCQILPKKRTETNIVLIILYGAYYRVHDYTDTVSYHLLYMNQIPVAINKSLCILDNIHVTLKLDYRNRYTVKNNSSINKYHNK